jgi:hypothetical protein
VPEIRTPDRPKANAVDLNVSDTNNQEKFAQKR